MPPMCQVHQFFVWCSVETRLGVEAINDMQSLKATCRSVFEEAQTNPSAAQEQVSKTLRDMSKCALARLRGLACRCLAHRQACCCNMLPNVVVRRYLAWLFGLLLPQ